MGQVGLDPKEVLERLRAEHQVLRWTPLPPDEALETGAEQAAPDRTALEYLHNHWAIADAAGPSPSSSGFRGKAAALFSRLTFRALGPYHQREQEFLARAVQVIDELDRRCTELDRRCTELGAAMLDRQVAESENQAKLALWLHLEPPSTAAPPSPDVADQSGGGPSTTP